MVSCGNSTCSSMEVCAEDLIDSSGSGKVHSVCEHKALLPICTADVFTTMALFVGLSLASAGGVGGGALVVPILVLLEDFSAGAAVPFAQLCGFATAIPRFFMALGSRADSQASAKSCALFNFDAFLILTPAALLGNLVGVHLNVTSPQLALFAVMVGLLTFIATRILMRGRKMWYRQRAQRRLREKVEASLLNQETQKQDQLSSPLDNFDRVVLRSKCNGLLASQAMLILFACISSLAYIKGAPGRESPIGIALCSLTFWSLDLVAFAVLSAFLAISAAGVIRQHNLRSNRQSNLGAASLTTNLRETGFWTPQKVLRNCLCAILAGCASAYIGIGGGIIIGFLLHEMKLLPQVASATTTLITLFTCGSNVIQYSLRGKLLLDYGALLLAISVVAGWFGQMVVTRLVRSSQSDALVVLALGLMVAAADVMLTAIGVSDTLSALRHGTLDFRFHSPCKESGTELW